MIQQNYEVEVLVNGNPAKEYFKDGKVYIEGRKGVEYSLRVKNNGSQRIIAVPTVDGLSVMDGKEASYGSSGYIINGYDSLIIKGWRKSDTEVASFFFSDPSESYGERTDKGGNLGVIGMAITPEKQHAQVALLYTGNNSCCFTKWCYSCNRFHRTCQGCIGSGITSYTSSNNSVSINITPTVSATMTNMATMSQSQQVGTGWGETKRSEVISVDFEKESISPTVFQLFYNTREQLQALGVEFNSKPVYVSPQSFPGQYCEPPKK